MEEKLKKERKKKVILKSKLTSKEFGERLKKVNYKKADFARFVGLDDQTVRGWTDGDIPLYVEKLIEFLEITFEANKNKNMFEKIYQNNIAYEAAKLKRLSGSRTR